jgi:NADH-quinone oxidoreductase subunit K
MTISFWHFACVAFLLFSIGAIGLVLNRRNLILILMSLEIILLSISLFLVSVSRYRGVLEGEIFALIILAVAAAEAAIGLALLMMIYRKHKSISLECLKEMRG